MKYNPCLYEAVPENKIIIDSPVKVSCSQVYFKNDDIKYDVNKKPYLRYSDSLYCRLDVKKDGFILPENYFTFVSYNELKAVEEERDSRKRKERLREIFDEKTGKKNGNYTEGAFEHPSEWHKDDSACRGTGFKQKIVKRNLAVWGKDYLNKSLPEEIRDCRELTFFYKTQFESFLSDLHKSYADKLIKVQDTVMRKYSYRQGNLGLYEGANGFKAYNTQTYCNHAVFETIVKVDGNFNNFVHGDDSPPWNIKNHTYLSSEIKADYINEKFKNSNIWCDVLEYQSKNPAESGVCRISAEQAFYMASLGYVVIASWKNLETDRNKNRSPHFVTVSPEQDSMKFIDMASLIVAHVGGGRNMFCRMTYAFDGSGNAKENRYDEVRFYVNFYQNFR